MTDPNVLLNSQTASDLSRQSQKREAMTTAPQRVERTETLPGSSFVRRENQISKVEIDEKKMKKALRELS